MKSILSRSGIYGIDYSINPYFGCMHGCLYCYARYMLKRFPAGLKWGEFVHVKINAPRILIKDLRHAKFGRILLSSVTDPYQPIESKYEVTRKILRILASKKFPVTILTKSSLVTRDVDLLRLFRDVEIGLTITTINEDVRSIFEPRASPSYERLNALKQLKEDGFTVFAFLGPLIPVICEEGLESLIKELKKINVDYVVVDKLNVKAGNWPYIKNAILNYFPQLFQRIEEILFNRGEYARYYLDLKYKLLSLASDYDLEVEFCY